nr:PREDICTED: mas-related G-protein coupled receptor member B5-like [Austrofundulus limnaeus]
MENFYFSNTSHDNSYNYSNNSNINENPDSYGKYIHFSGFTYVALITVTSFGLFVTLLAIFAAYTLTKQDHATPVYIINLLVSDLIQLCSMMALITVTHKSRDTIIQTYLLGVMASVGFMVCVSLERYLVIAKPLWYRFRRNIKAALALCVGVWAGILVLRLIVYLVGFGTGRIITAVFLLAPFPFFVFFLAGTLKALSAAKVPVDEKRRVVAILVLVLLIYTLLFLPIIVFCLVKEARDNVKDDCGLQKDHNTPITTVACYRFLSTTITQDLKWESTISSLIKKVQKRISSITVWYAGATARDRHRLQHVVHSAEKVIGCSLPSLHDLYVSRTVRRAGRITADPSHPAGSQFIPLPSGRRFRSIRARTSHHKNSFFPSAIGLLNI